MKKKKDEPVPNVPPIQETKQDAPPKPADLVAEFGPTVKRLLIEALALRVAKLAMANQGVIVHPVDEAQVAAAQVRAEEIARLERSACLAIVDRFVSDPAMLDKIHGAVVRERGSIAFAMNMQMTYDESKRKWKSEWALAN